MKSRRCDSGEGFLITPKNQGYPDDTRRLFIAGALHEAEQQGYSIFARGRILVLAMRTWEGR